VEVGLTVSFEGNNYAAIALAPSFSLLLGALLTGSRQVRLGTLVSSGGRNAAEHATIRPKMDFPKKQGVALNRRNIVFENARFQVFADHIADSRGNEILDFLVVAPRNRTVANLTGVLVIPVQDSQILFLNAYRHPIGRRVLEFPRGFIDAGEEPSEAAVRELNEETGLVCEPGSLVSLGFVHPDPGVLAARVALFAATDCRTGGSRVDDEIGIDEGIWISVAEAQRMLRGHEFEEASTCVALHRYFGMMVGIESAF